MQRPEGLPEGVRPQAQQSGAASLALSCWTASTGLPSARGRLPAMPPLRDLPGLPSADSRSPALRLALKVLRPTGPSAWSGRALACPMPLLELSPGSLLVSPPTYRNPVHLGVYSPHPSTSSSHPHPFRCPLNAHRAPRTTCWPCPPIAEVHWQVTNDKGCARSGGTPKKQVCILAEGWGLSRKSSWHCPEDGVPPSAEEQEGRTVPPGPPCTAPCWLTPDALDPWHLAWSAAHRTRNT